MWWANVSDLLSIVKLIYSTGLKGSEIHSTGFKASERGLRRLNLTGFKGSEIL